MASDDLICFCFSVTEEEIRQAIRDHNLTSVDDIGACCEAGMGCRTCRFELEDILAEERARQAEDTIATSPCTTPPR